MNSDNSKPRLPGLDLIRAVAIVWVMMFHMRSTLPALLSPLGRYGWMGVDLFFVLSGYLIGSQLLRPYSCGQKPSLRDFYTRRFFRVIPCFVVVLVLYFSIPTFREAHVISPLWMFLTFSLNLLSDYSTAKAFSHAWSLCVEEHFYLTLPFIVIWLMKKPRFLKTAMLILFVILFGILVRTLVWFELRPPTGVDYAGYSTLFIEKLYYPTFGRLDGLLVGVVIATIQIFRPVWWQKIMASWRISLLSGLCLAALAFALFTDRFPTHPFSLPATAIGFPLLSTSFGLLMIAALSGSQILSKVSKFGASAIATISYSLYLLHKEIIHLDQLFLDPLVSANRWQSLLVYMTTCIAAASILYLLVERPFLKLRRKLLEPAE